ncbi:hypothetical protein BRADI_1g73058v3 [Brachypodium distachyon]|uniref:Uncharacterized protein n=1 Tax=Brachypodium distachyon TaxID=15368 RepID=A0A2K2DUV2_BRADI|nr:hypothetical protein BRADI_1g73058v3 [Brachypodium distachyon]
MPGEKLWDGLSSSSQSHIRHLHHMNLHCQWCHNKVFHFHHLLFHLLLLLCQMVLHPIRGDQLQAFDHLCNSSCKP